MLPSPRLVSTTISNETNGPTDQADNRRSGMNMAFGQLLAHDIIKTELHTGKHLLQLVREINIKGIHLHGKFWKY